MIENKDREGSIVQLDKMNPSPLQAGQDKKEW
jgi:hypothetical protein